MDGQALAWPLPGPPDCPDSTLQKIAWGVGSSAPQVRPAAEHGHTSAVQQQQHSMELSIGVISGTTATQLSSPWCNVTRKFPSPLISNSAADVVLLQVEGSPTAGNRSLSVWDVFAAKSGNIQDGSNPSVATDFYNKYKEDIALMKAMGVKNFRSAEGAHALTYCHNFGGHAPAAAAEAADLQQQQQQQQHFFVQREQQPQQQATAESNSSCQGGHDRGFIAQVTAQTAVDPSSWCTEAILSVDRSVYTQHDGVAHCTQKGACYPLTPRLSTSACRMSISWSRLIPGGVKGSALNPEGVKFYNNVFEELQKNGIEPAVTLYHWDMPQVMTCPGLLKQTLTDSSSSSSTSLDLQ